MSSILKRADGRIEWVCDHGVGHTVYAPFGGDFVHGCDGCCDCDEYKKLRNKVGWKVLGMEEELLDELTEEVKA